MATEANKNVKKAKAPSRESIVNVFHSMRNEQRSLTTKLSELEFEVKEHIMVIESLKKVDQDRTCHRLIGDVLVEKQVKDVLPDVTSDKKNVEEVIEKMKASLAKMGQELIDYKAKHGIRIRRQDDLKTEPNNETDDTKKEETRGNVLVSKISRL